jgi:hypothetical protein
MGPGAAEGAMQGPASARPVVCGRGGAPRLFVESRPGRRTAAAQGLSPSASPQADSEVPWGFLSTATLRVPPDHHGPATVQDPPPTPLTHLRPVCRPPASPKPRRDAAHGAFPPDKRTGPPHAGGQLMNVRHSPLQGRRHVHLAGSGRHPFRSRTGAGARALRVMGTAASARPCLAASVPVEGTWSVVHRLRPPASSPGPAVPGPAPPWRRPTSASNPLPCNAPRPL